MRRTIGAALLIIVLSMWGGATVSRAAPVASCAPSWGGVGGSPPSGFNPDLKDVAMVSPGDVWAVGTDSAYLGRAQQTLTMHWNGAQWSQIPSPNVGASHNVLWAVSANSSMNVWASGSYRDSGNNDQPLIMRWDGTTWSLIPGPAGLHGAANVLLALSPSDVWLSASWHWDGSSWTATPTDGSTVLDIAGTSSTDIWAVGYSGSGTAALHWNGSTWTRVPTPNPTGADSLTGVTAISPSDVWAVGSSFIDAGHTNVLIEHWNGSSWSVVPAASLPLAFTESSLTKVSALSPGDVWAVGDKFNGSFLSERALVEHWDGTNWSALPGQGLVSSLSSVSASAGNVWAVTQGFAERLCPIAVSETGFSPQTSQVPQGSAAAWTISSSDTQAHSVTDASGMGLFDSGLRAPGASYTFVFSAAGTYKILDSSTQASSLVRVPVQGFGTTPSGPPWQLVWSSSPGGFGFVFDVQIKRPNATGFSTWQNGVTAASAQFSPDAGAGTYSFRARLRNTGNGKASGWSPPFSLKAS